MRTLRIAAVGILLPLVTVAAAFLVPLSLGGLPAEIPSHWRGGEATSFMPVASMANGWGVGVAVVAAITIGIASSGIGRLRWSNLHRGLTAVGVGAAVAAASSLIGQLLLMRGQSVSEAASTGPGAGILILMAAFIVAGLLALFALPPGLAGIAHSPLLGKMADGRHA